VHSSLATLLLLLAADPGLMAKVGLPRGVRAAHDLRQAP
jgi:hypothetical protein